MEPEDNHTLDLALHWAAQGFRVFAVSPGKKTPRFSRSHPRWGHGHKDATTDPDVIRAMWREGGPDCNIGIATGPESNLLVIDIDNKDRLYNAGLDSNVRMLLDKLGLDRLPHTMRVRTPRLGLHLWYRYPEGHVIKGGTQMLSHMVDHQSIGRYVLAPGSRIKDPDLCYPWLLERGGAAYYQRGHPSEIAQLPVELIDLMESVQAAPANPADSEGLVSARESGPSFAQLWAEKGICLRGGDQLYLCPFHDDHHPSLHINTEKEVWRCFACDREGGYRMLWREVRPGQKLPGGGQGQLTEEDAQVLEKCRELLNDITLFQTANDHMAFKVLVRAAEEKGSLALGVPIRWLGEEAGFTKSTSPEVLRRLVEGAFIERAEVQGTTASGFRILSPVNSTLNKNGQSYDSGVGSGPSPWGVEGVEGVEGVGVLAVVPLEPDLPISHDALRHGAWGAAYKTAVHLAQVKKDTVSGIQAALHYKGPRTVYSHLARLRVSECVIKDGHLYRWVTPNPQILDEFAEVSGTAGKGEEDKRQHEHDREGYQAHQDYLAQQRTISAQKRAQRRLQRALDQPTVPAHLQHLIVVPGHISRIVDTQTGEVKED